MVVVRLLKLSDTLQEQESTLHNHEDKGHFIAIIYLGCFMLISFLEMVVSSKTYELFY